MVRFLRGNFIAIDGSAMQDFEDCTVATITDSPFEFIGEDDTNGCDFEAATFIGRT